MHELLKLIVSDSSLLEFDRARYDILELGLLKTEIGDLSAIQNNCVGGGRGCAQGRMYLGACNERQP